MASTQDYYKINGDIIRQPDEGLTYNWETTYTSDSTRVQSGADHFTPMFTVQQFGYSASSLSLSELAGILKHIVKGKLFTLHYLNPVTGKWEDGQFRVAKGSLEVGRINVGAERCDNLSFNMTGKNPI